MGNHFREFLNHYLACWSNSSLAEMKELISTDYQAREITNGEIVDFGYTESLIGWEQGFNFVEENEAEWNLNEIYSIPLRQDEWLSVISANLTINGESLDSANLFFQTFKLEHNTEWKLIRSYIEAGIPIGNLSDLHLPTI